MPEAELKKKPQSSADIAETVETKTRMLCSHFGVWPHLQMGVTVNKFAEDLRYGLPNL